MAKVELDPDTGLPALPEGYWWRVQTGGLSDQVLYVTIMCPSRPGFERQVASNMTWGESQKAIRNAAIRLVKWDRDWKRHRAKIEYKRSTKYLQGDYPPKKLGGAK